MNRYLQFLYILLKLFKSTLSYRVLRNYYNFQVKGTLDTCPTKTIIISISIRNYLDIDPSIPRITLLPTCVPIDDIADFINLSSGVSFPLFLLLAPVKIDSKILLLPLDADCL